MLNPTGGLGLGQAYGGPAPVEMGLRDRLDLALPSSASGTVYDLVGNVSELMADSFEPLTGSCWSAPGVYRDPICTAETGSVSVRGGDWTSDGSDARAASRNLVPSASVSAQGGFRCVRDGR